ncbi:hypothetical protein M2161_004890 [Streptomyces sp. SAI-133]|nr:hypothetical protein [Streptomyces sp. SAI-133]
MAAQLPLQQRRRGAGLVVLAGHLHIAYGPVGTEVFLGAPTVEVDEQGPVR